MSLSGENPYKHLPTIDTTKEKLIPKGYTVLVKMPALEEKTAGGIILSSETLKKDQVKPSRAILLAIGDMAFSGSVGVRGEIGDEVIVPRYAGMDYIDVATSDIYKVCHDDEIKAVIEKLT